MKRLLACLLVATLWWPALAFGQTCTARMDDVRFGDIDPRSNANSDVNGEVTVTCNRILAPFVRVCIHMGSPTGVYDPRRMDGPDARRLDFNIYKDAAHTQIWGSRHSVAHDAQFVDIPLPLGSNSRAVSFHARVPGQQDQVTTGLYSASYSTNDLFIEWAGFFQAPPDCSQRLPASATFSSQINANVTGDCMVSATNIDFGQIGTEAIDRPIESVGVITMNCTNKLKYTVALNAGLGPGATVAERMLTRAGGGGHVLRYLLFSSRTSRHLWGDGTLGTDTVKDKGTGNAQTFTVYGELLRQPTPEPGNYADLVTVTVTY